MDNAFNDNSQTHYYGPAPPANERFRPQNPTHKSPQLLGNSTIQQGVHQIDRSFRQAFSNRSLSEGNVVPNMPRNNDDDESDENDGSYKPPPPLSTSSSEPIYTTYKGNLTKYDNSVRETNVSSYNTKDNKIINAFNDKISDDYLRHG